MTKSESKWAVVTTAARDYSIDGRKVVAGQLVPMPCSGMAKLVDLGYITLLEGELLAAVNGGNAVIPCRVTDCPDTFLEPHGELAHWTRTHLAELREAQAELEAAQVGLDEASARAEAHREGVDAARVRLGAAQEAVHQMQEPEGVKV